jgi:hypothetical protein
VPDNPFSTRRVRPGAIPYIFPPGQDVRALVDRLRQSGWWGEIVGPHGSGKSTLLATLITAVECAGRTIIMVELHDGQRCFPLKLYELRLRCPAMLVVDGYEQLSRWNRWRLKRSCRRHGVGLVVTAHKSVGFPELCRTTATPELARRIVAKLLGGSTGPFSPDEVAEVLARRRGDLREMLFDLYDFYEQRRGSSKKGPCHSEQSEESPR